MMDEIKSLIRDRQQQSKVCKRQVKESEIPLSVLYNEKVERIRSTEQSVRSAPMAIRFKITDSHTGKSTRRHVELHCESVPGP